ncbi:TIR domain-containing protein [Microbacterium sp. BWR-S6Y]|uniref:TIR domain-containing protein n=1 Tax=Microbacterium sp. BWR-S6Y TaxID=3232073 RepID=UPI0035292F8C
MPSEVFKRADMRYLVSALSDNTTHGGISQFELSVGTGTDVGANKTTRATGVVRYMFQQSDTDSLVVGMLNFLFVENPHADLSDDNASYKALRTNVLEPRSIRLTENGFALPDGSDIDTLERVQRPVVAMPDPATIDPWAAASAPWGTTPATVSQPAIRRDTSKVFVVHGRDMRPVEVIKQYLLYLGLHVMPWSEAVRLTGESQPHTYDVVRAGMAGAAAIIVIFSPDDLARVKDDFSEAGDPDRTPQGQARQNVLLEAGMAFAMERKRTIFVKSAPTRDISDVAGFNWVKLDGVWDSRKDLKNRLETAGATVRRGDYDLMDSAAGTFRVL